ncbi:MAG: hypothetical protein M5R36_14095 [Deltaproteobacteria bacterium]|nr:hypothetical protein [Deltaproteobacteria bacterium]
MTPLAAQTGPSGADDPYCGTDWHGPGPGDDDDDSDDDDPSDDDASGDDDNDDDDGGCCGC